MTYCRSFPNRGEIEEFLKALAEKKASASTLETFRGCAKQTPVDRLGFNLAMLLSQLTVHPVSDLMHDGFFPSEADSRYRPF